jgi:hypothetical protein
MTLALIHRVWASQVVSEYQSAALTAGLLHQLILIGAPDPLVRVAHRVVTDELDHALLCHETLLAYGGGDVPVAVEPGVPLPIATLDELLPTAMATIVRTFCFGETIAVPLFAAMRREATGPALKVLDRIVQDEAVHSKLGWDALDWLIDGYGAPIRILVAAHLPEILEGFEVLYGRRKIEELDADDRAAGLLPASLYREVLHATVRRTILPRLVSRGVSIDSVSELHQSPA